jgi:hypothetical protein
MTINSAITEFTQHPVYDKKEIKDILAESKSINIEDGANEILTWIANNVEEFIDNQKKIFKLDLVLDAEDNVKETMPNIRKLQNLYRAIPEDPTSEIESIDSLDNALDSLSTEDKKLLKDINDCRNELDNITKSIYEKMKTTEELLNAIFKRMIFYYEIKGVNNGILLLQELEGQVDIIKFEYESFPVSVKVSDTTKHEVVNEYIIPEGFTVWIEIAFTNKKSKNLSMF